MKLAEALQERADLNAKINQLETRLDNNALVQEGEKTAENPQELLKLLDETVARLRELMARINLTNCMTKCETGSTITELIAKRDTLQRQIGVYRDLINTASQSAYRAKRTEIKVYSTFDVPELQKKTDKLFQELRLTDNTIQALNWQTELL